MVCSTYAPQACWIMLLHYISELGSSVFCQHNIRAGYSVAPYLKQDRQHSHPCVTPLLTLRSIMMVSWGRHQMETFSALLVLCEGNPPVASGFLSQRPVTRSFDVSLICAWTHSWANARDAGGLRCHPIHHGVTVMYVFNQSALVDSILEICV